RDVQGGSELVAATGTTMQEIVRSTRQVADLMEEITSSTTQQSASLGHMSDEIHRIDRVTQQNAALVEESAAAADSLNSQAARLVQLVSVFQIESSAHAVIAQAQAQSHSSATARGASIAQAQARGLSSAPPAPRPAPG
ncbi:methyl-accepting chemotaxis protein, partial [Corallococcus exiguus]|nr:methyl-accepting chemotaxis protein [Corallococcus exiguus]